MCHYLRTYYWYEAAEKKHSTALLQLFRVHSIRINLTSTEKAIEVKKGQIAFFARTVFRFCKNFEIRKLETLFWRHRVPLAETRRNIYMLTKKDRFQNLTSGQGHVR